MSGNPPQELLLQAPVSASALEWLDGKRNGTGVELEWRLIAQVAGRQRSTTQGMLQPSRATIAVSVRPERWNELMTAMGYERRVYMGGSVAVGGPAFPPSLAKAGKLMEEAIHQHRANDIRGAVNRCRDVLDEIAGLCGGGHPPVQGYRDTQQGSEERLLYARDAVRHVTHIGAHASAGTLGGDQTRLVVELTAALLRHQVALARA